jgi:hypothetical protein
MWLFVIVLLNGDTGINTVTVLDTYGNLQECQHERNRVSYEMAAAYPNDRDFVIACKLNPKHEP